MRINLEITNRRWSSRNILNMCFFIWTDFDQVTFYQRYSKYITLLQFLSNFFKDLYLYQVFVLIATFNFILLDSKSKNYTFTLMLNLTRRRTTELIVWTVVYAHTKKVLNLLTQVTSTTKHSWVNVKQFPQPSLVKPVWLRKFNFISYVRVLLLLSSLLFTNFVSSCTIVT